MTGVAWGAGARAGLERLLQGWGQELASARPQPPPPPPAPTPPIVPGLAAVESTSASRHDEVTR
eukprot:SAG25_NODE_193_length_12184_cov_5.527844_13_plen_64_part_00